MADENKELEQFLQDLLRSYYKNLKNGHIYVNGNKARDLYMKYTLPQTGIPCITLPSTSLANAAFSVDRLVGIWEEKLYAAKALK